ncbi:MurR/RpiR family transcriptional regulator [Actinospica sp. MGRD01-02]|uniref:MurR/RpiR family transcriptional regulator n=1 Tax=Actinospica acidithermotolerans TaxID=2828514 RepID=A0A941ED65_9ACTN|nr:MurR/RpiR family transcriptional regulator [Actinospica acidithermotolerans]MBR7829142.1 MurR/RpiR family transcriptional regulator [Actinospica acidithermotolerans]
MNDAGLGQRIDRLYASLSPQEQRAADVVLDRLDDLAVYNASEIAQISGVSKATVSRLVRRLGYEDFAQVRAQARTLRSLGTPLGTSSAYEASADASTVAGGSSTLAAHLASSAYEACADASTVAGGSSTLAAHLASSAYEASADASTVAGGSSTLAAHLASELRNLESMLLRTLADGRAEKAAALLASAEAVAVIGRRNSYPVALHLRQQLAQIRGRVALLPVPGQSLGEDLAALGPSDAAVLVGFRRRPRGFARLVEVLAARGVPVVLIGDESLEPWQDRVAHFLPVPLDAPSPFDSYAAAMSLVNVLATATLARRTRQGRTRVSVISGLYEELDELEEPW